MPAAARISDQTNHGGTIVGPGNPTVLIGGFPAATLGDTHHCALPESENHPSISACYSGSNTVFIGGKPALRSGDPIECGAIITGGLPTVLIG
ncbi:PaaR repeat-containing protein [Algoriphagus kandeliae]|uniref:PaaR repeat-containing protein n=1 Tax=Algoriphagus kandeliae TaxID=2562278 RepID=A0A4Y9QWT7_9BACT|nr:PAAR domain-containing protein [Algoriphagus kandeliae]TFV95546.1 PaaR repeat-containing protein [Algoriphagus kandeliae]